MNPQVLSFFAALAALSLPLLASPKAISEAYRRSVFHTGGEYTLLPSTNSTILINQIYVEQSTPLRGKRHKILLFSYVAHIDSLEFPGI